MNNTALVITASVQSEASISRQLVSELIDHLVNKGVVDTVIERDLSKNNLALITAEHVAAYYSAPEERSEDQLGLLAQSDSLLEELKQANTLVIGTPMYNFSVPAALKAWIDLVCRVGETFHYTEQGPVGLLNIDTAYLVVSTGGTPVNSAFDFVVPYLTKIAGFLGVKNVRVIAADRTTQGRELSLKQARQAIVAA